MGNIGLVELSEKGLNLSGDLRFLDFSKLKKQGFYQLKNLASCKIDCTKAEKIDSAVLSLFLVWIAYAKKHGFKIAFHGLPNQAKTMIALYGLSHIFKNL